MTKQKLVVIPISLEAVNRLNYDLCTDGDLIEILLENSEYNTLYDLGLFDEINKHLSLNLGDYEDEIIFNDKFIELQEILCRFIKNNPKSPTLIKFNFICNIAFEINTAIFVSF